MCIRDRYEVSLEEFRSKMDCPKAYNNKQFMQNIINPALKELKENEYFKNLECTVQYAHKRGCPVVGYAFTFDPEERIHNGEIKQKEQKSNSKMGKDKSRIKNSRFNNIESREYDYGALEKQLLNNPKGIVNSEE